MANDANFNFYVNRQGPRGQKGEKGDQGFSPSITVNTNTADEYTLLIQNEYNNFVTDNIRPTYDDRGGTYVRVDRANNVQYFGSADIATTANYGEVKLAQASDLASTVDVGNSNVITVELLKTWFDGQLADNLVTTTNNVTIQGQKVFATPTRFMDTVRVGNRLMVAQEDTGTITFDTDKDGTLIGTHLTSTGDASFTKNVEVDGIATIKGGLNVAGNAVISSPQLGNTTVSGGLTTKADISIKGQYIHLQDTNPTIYLKNMNGVNEIEIFRGLFTAGNPNPADNYLSLGHSQLQLNLTGKAIKANGKDVATADTVDAIQSDLNIAKQDIIEAQGDIDNLQMNKQNKLTAGTGITIDADNVISATGGVVDLPIASSTTLGGIKVGENLTISEDGTLSATSGGTGDVSAAGNNTFTGENTFNGAVNLNGVSIAENLTVTGNLTSNGEVNAVSIKTTGLRSDDIQTTTNKKYLTEADVDNQTIQVVDGKLHANLESALANKQDKLTAGEGIQIEQVTDGTLPFNWYGENPSLAPIPTPIPSEIDIKKELYPCYGSNIDSTTTHSATIKYTMRVRSGIGNMQGRLGFYFSNSNEITYEYRNNQFAVFPRLKNNGANVNLNVSQNRLSVNEGDLITTEMLISSSKKNIDIKVYNEITGAVYATATASNVVWSDEPTGEKPSPHFYYRGQNAMGLLTDSIVFSNMEDAQTQNIISIKPDGTTITINDDGTISAVGNGGTTLQQGTQFTLNLTDNGTLGGSTPACTGSSYETGHPYYYAFKGATSSTPTKELWGPSSSAGNEYLILDCVTPIPLQSFRWTNGGNSQERFPTIVFKGSNDNSNYTTLGTYNTQNATDDSVTIENYTPYRYYRFDFPTGANYGKLGFISMSGFNRYNILNIGDGLDVVDGQLTCTATADAPVTGVSAPLKLSGDAVNVPEMTGQTTDGFTVTASRFSATYSSQYYKCFNADGSGWYAGNKEDGSDYIQIVFPRLLNLRGAYIKQNGQTNSLVSDYTLLITQNGSNWTEVLSDKLPQTVNYETSKIINSNCLGFRFRADGNYATNGAAISGITLDLTELPTTATLGYDDNFVLDDSNQLSLNSAKFGKLSSPILDVQVNNCVLAMPTAPTFDGTNVKVYAGTKVAIPNGLNADGTCKSNIVTLTADATINQSTFNGDVTLMLKSDGTIDQTAYSYFEVDDISTITTLTAYCWYYDRKTNNHYLASSEGAKQGPYQRIKIGSYNQVTTTSAGGKENALRYFRYETPLSLHKESAFNLLPDYTKPSTFTNNVIIVADRDYWICGQFNVDTKQNSTINFYSSSGTTVAAYDLCSGSAYTNRRFHNIPIPKGTIYMVACTNESSDAKIYPCIGGVNG